jgi:hypothetical protein
MARAVSEEWDRVLMAFGFWPALWCLWSGVTRGGLALRLAGVALRDRNGRPAPRWRCLWRAAVVWLPVLALLLLSFGLDVGRVAFLEDGPFGDAAAWLAWWAWWQAALLLPAFAWAGVTWPNRGIHDRLAGTYPVPRS